jgi:hypothetical protein
MTPTMTKRDDSLERVQAPPSARTIFAPFVVGTFTSTQPSRVIALVSCKENAGVGDAANTLYDFLTLDMNYRSILLTVNDILSKGQTEQRMNSLRQDYDAVLIDCGAMSVSVAPLRIASLVDGCILVVSSGDTDKNEIRKARDLIKAAQGHVLGILLINVQDPIPHLLKPLFR